MTKRFPNPVLFLGAFLFSGAFLRASPEDEAAIQAVEKEMAERPLEALAIARRANFDSAEDRRRLFRTAAHHQEKELNNLNEGQVADLAKVFEQTLRDDKSSLRVRLDWLRQRGMTQEEVRRLLGSPKRKSWQILYRHQIEQWAYDEPAVRIDFDCVKGLDPKLLSVHSRGGKNR